MPLDEATCLLGLRLSVLCHYINTPLQTARRSTLNISVDRSVGLVAHHWVMLGIVVSKVGLTRYQTPNRCRPPGQGCVLPSGPLGRD